MLLSRFLGVVVVVATAVVGIRRCPSRSCACFVASVADVVGDVASWLQGKATSGMIEQQRASAHLSDLISLGHRNGKSQNCGVTEGGCRIRHTDMLI